MEEEKKQQRKEKRHNGKGTSLPSEGPTSWTHPGPALPPSWDTEGPSAKEDWLFLSRICTQNFAFFIHFLGFPGSAAGEESACNAGTPVHFLGWEDPLENR